MIIFYLLILLMAIVRHPLLAPLVGEDVMFKYVGAMCVVYALYYLLRRGSVPHVFRTWQMRVFTLLYGLAMLSYFTIGLNYTPALTYTSMLLLLLITMTIVDTQKRLRNTAIAMVASLAFASLYVIREWQVYHSVYAGLRASGITGDSNYFSASAVIALPIAYFLASKEESRLVRLFSVGSLLVILVATMLAASRGGLIGLGVAATFIAIRSRRRVLALLAIASGLTLFLVFAPNSPLDRFLNPGYGDRLAVDARMAAWTAGARMIQAHPMYGVGVGNFKAMMPQFAGPEIDYAEIAHNTYIEMAAEMGIPGLLLFLSLLGATFFSLQHTRARALELGLERIHRIAGALQAGLLGFSVSAVVLSAEYQKLFWLIVGISASMPQIVDNGERAAAQDEHGLEAEGLAAAATR